MELTMASSRMTTVPDITFRSDMTVELIKYAASDADVIWAARVSTKGEQSLADVDGDTERSAGLINFLMRDRTGTPFEHSSMTFYVSAPIFVFREFMRTGRSATTRRAADTASWSLCFTCRALIA